ncbi:MAG: LamG domain-containing protein [Flavisolibacter sp.]
MKYNLYILAIAAMGFSVTSCKKTGADTGVTVNSVAPSVTTNNSSNMNGTSITVGGNVTTDGGSLVKETGIVYGTAPNVDTTKTRVRNYTIGGSYSITLSGLSLLTPYYYKAYAINEKGITYGAEKTFFLPVNGYSTSSQVAPANLVGYWAFDGSLIDSVSGQSAVGTGTSFGTGTKKQAMQTGANGYALFTPGTSITGVSSFTIAYWVNAPVNTAGIAGTVNLSNNTGFWGNIDGFFENGSSNAAATFKSHFTNGNGKEHWLVKTDLANMFGKWNNIAISFDGSSKTFTMYVNGTQVATETDAAFGDLQFTNSGKLVFGTVQFMTNPSLTSSHGAEGWAGYLNGSMDEVRIYNKALSGDEILALYALQNKGY